MTVTNQRRDDETPGGQDSTPPASVRVDALPAPAVELVSDEPSILDELDLTAPVAGTPELPPADPLGEIAVPAVDLDDLDLRAPCDDDPDTSTAETQLRSGHAEELTQRALYERELAALSVDARVARAGTERGPLLAAACFAPEPQVIAALIENSAFGLAHARLIARHHQNPRGLEMLARRPELARDNQVQRRLLQNPQLPETLVKALLVSKSLLELYRRCVDRELPERTRSLIRRLLRERFATAQADERVQLLMKTEGRPLALLTGATFDGRTTAMLCSRSFHSVLFIQNLARFAATPPPLLAHLLRQPLVRRQKPLQNLLLRHPNMSSSAKRGL
jgi:hypothetical protein